MLPFLAKNIANTYELTHIQEEVMYFGTYLLFIQFMLSASHLTVVVSVLLRMFMLVDSCCVRLVYSCVA